MLNQKEEFTSESDPLTLLSLYPLVDLPPGSALDTEWKTYRRELPRLLVEGQEGRFALIKGADVNSIWESLGDAMQAGRQRFGMATFLVQQILHYERPLRVGGYW